MSRDAVIQLLYLVASALFIQGLRGLGSPETARRGVMWAEVGMFCAVIGTLLQQEIITYTWIIVGVAIGSAIGAAMAAWIPMTKMPERIALSHAFGGLAVVLVGVTEFLRHGGDMSHLQMAATGFEVFLGALTFTGSLMAFGKLQGFITGKPLLYPGQNVSNVALLLLSLALIVINVLMPGDPLRFWALPVLGLLLGVLLVIPIGGADMPVVICLLNSYAGLAASATGFALGNNVLIICGALDGGSGFVLGMMMSKAMNRSFANVLFGGVGATPAGATATAITGGAAAGPLPNEGTVDDAVDVLRGARSIIVIPGYGMAVSQAQHAVRDLANYLTSQGTQVRYAIHPVAGRMPGHMNVLLAEANVPYDQLYDLDAINDDFGQTDVALVVGANDVVNPAARTDPSSPIHGMPVFNVELARTSIVLKRSLNPGFAGVENQLFVKPNTMMVLGDAKKSITGMTSKLKEA
jgi:proton-translocating NAD(P)+ transhydrogenase subunit beta